MSTKRFADFAQEAAPLDGEKIKIDHVLDREVQVIGYSIRKSRYEKNKSGKCLLLQVDIDGHHRLLITGSDVLIEQMDKYGSQIPFFATIKKIDRFYTLS